MRLDIASKLKHSGIAKCKYSHFSVNKICETIVCKVWLIYERVTQLIADFMYWHSFAIVVEMVLVKLKTNKQQLNCSGIVKPLLLPSIASSYSLTTAYKLHI